MATFFKLIIAGGLLTMFTPSKMVATTILLSSQTHQQFLVRLKSKLKDQVGAPLLFLFLMKTATLRFNNDVFLTFIATYLGPLCPSGRWSILDGLLQRRQDLGSELLPTGLDVWPVSSYECDPGVGKKSFTFSHLRHQLLIFSRSLSPVTG